MCSRKDFSAIARVVAQAKDKPKASARIATALADYFSAHYPTFHRELFLTACTTGEPLL